MRADSSMCIALLTRTHLLGDVGEQLDVDNPVVHVREAALLGRLAMTPRVEVERVLQLPVLHFYRDILLAQLLVAFEQILEHALLSGVKLEMLGQAPAPRFGVRGHRRVLI